MRNFWVTVRTAAQTLRYIASASSTISAYESAADAQGDVVCGITVMPV